MLRRELTKALVASPDFSVRFTAKISGLCSELEAELGVDFVHDNDMNYNASQRLQLYLDHAGSQVLELVAKWRIDFYFSSKAPLFAYIIFKRTSEPGIVWQLMIPEADPPASIKEQASRTAAAVEKCGWGFVSPAEWTPMAPGCTTELDGVPATVFQSLFAELL